MKTINYKVKDLYYRSHKKKILDFIWANILLSLWKWVIEAIAGRGGSFWPIPKLENATDLCPPALGFIWIGQNGELNGEHYIFQVF